LLETYRTLLASAQRVNTHDPCGIMLTLKIFYWSKFLARPTSTGL